MSLYINTNSSAAYASFHLGRNNKSLHESLVRLSSGKRINNPGDDSGGLAVSMKLSSSINRLNAAERNLQNAISFIEVQDGILEAAGRIVDRMIELKGMSQDMMKNSFDNSTYNNEFRDLQMQLFDMTNQTFNGVSLFAQYNSEGGNGVFHAMPTTASRAFDNTVSIYTSADGSSGPTISINKSLLLSALTVNTSTLKSSIFSAGTTGNGVVANDRDAQTITFASEEIDTAIDLTKISVGVLNQVLENIAGLRAQNGATQSRLASLQITSSGRPLWKPRTAESWMLILPPKVHANKYNVLKQASAAMLAQANSGSDVALMLLR